MKISKAPIGYIKVTKGNKSQIVNLSTTLSGDLVWCTSKNDWIPVDSINAYVDEYHCVVRKKSRAKDKW